MMIKVPETKFKVENAKRKTKSAIKKLSSFETDFCIN